MVTFKAHGRVYTVNMDSCDGKTPCSHSVTVKRPDGTAEMRPMSARLIANMMQQNGDIHAHFKQYMPIKRSRETFDKQEVMLQVAKVKRGLRDTMGVLQGLIAEVKKIEELVNKT